MQAGLRRPFVIGQAQSYGPPLPQHLLADQYTANPTGFLDLPYWNQDYVGSGPFKVVSWDPGVGMQLTAHDGFALGRPKIADRLPSRALMPSAFAAPWPPPPKSDLQRDNAAQGVATVLNPPACAVARP